MDRQRLEKLLELFVDGLLTPMEKAELERMLLASPQARQIFWEHARFNALVRRYGEEEWGRKLANAESPLACELPAKKTELESPFILWWRAWQGVLSGALAATVVAFAIWWGVRPEVQPSKPKTATIALEEPMTAGVAVITRALDAVWDDKEMEPAVGNPIEPSRLKLNQGFVELEFFGGARVVVEGPAELQLVSGGEFICRSGKISAHVPKQARGFKVITPMVRVVDLGTAFGVDVTESRCEVHVFEGKVEVTEPVLKKTKLLLAGQATFIGAGSGWKEIALNRAAFATPGELDSQEAIVQARRFAEWKAASAKWRADQSMVTYYDFEDGSNRDRVLKNVGKNAEPDTDGVIIGASWGEGRWPSKRGLDFKNLGDRVRFQIPGEYQAITLHAWVQVGNLKRTFNSLMMCDGFQMGEVHWQLDQAGSIVICIQNREGTHGSSHHSPVVITPERFGEWVQIATTVDTEKKQVKFYLDGSLVGETNTGVKPPIRFGNVEIANWNSAEIGTSRPIRSFIGKMDEFALFSRALSGDEVAQLYQAGHVSSLQLSQAK
jgi:hypothetical protein